MEINIIRLLKAVLKKAWIIFLTAIVFCAGLYAYSSYKITPMYSATAAFYVNNSNEFDTKLTSSDVTVMEKLIGVYSEIARNDNVMNAVSQEMGGKYSPNYIKSMVVPQSRNATVIIDVTVTCPVPEDAQTIANLVVKHCASEIERIVNQTEITVVQDARLPSSPSSPNKKLYATVGFVAGFAISLAVIVILYCFDTRIKSVEEFTENFDEITVIGVIPNIA